MLAAYKEVVSQKSWLTVLFIVSTSFGAVKAKLNKAKPNGSFPQYQSTLNCYPYSDQFYYGRRAGSFFKSGDVLLWARMDAARMRKH